MPDTSLVIICDPCVELPAVDKVFFSEYSHSRNVHEFRIDNRRGWQFCQGRT